MKREAKRVKREEKRVKREEKMVKREERREKSENLRMHVLHLPYNLFVSMSGAVDSSFRLLVRRHLQFQWPCPTPDLEERGESFIWSVYQCVSAE